MGKGFTFIELLIILAIIAILAAVVFLAFDPLIRFQDARDLQRWSDVKATLDAIKDNQADNDGVYAEAVRALAVGKYATIGICATSGDSGCTTQITQAKCADITSLVAEGYLTSVPQDPSTGSEEKTDYYISLAETGVVTVGACDPEGGSAIEISH